jgi:hypothetical protein
MMCDIMRFVSLLVIVFALGTGLMAQDDLAQYQTHMKAPPPPTALSERP